ncbi:MAG: hypothetical protein ACPF8V_10225 [Luteibaculum sp.]
MGILSLIIPINKACKKQDKLPPQIQVQITYPYLEAELEGPENLMVFEASDNEATNINTYHSITYFSMVSNNLEKEVYHLAQTHVTVDPPTESTIVPNPFGFENPAGFYEVVGKAGDNKGLSAEVKQLFYLRRNPQDLNAEILAPHALEINRSEPWQFAANDSLLFKKFWIYIPDSLSSIDFYHLQALDSYQLPNRIGGVSFNLTDSVRLDQLGYIPFSGPAGAGELIIAVNSPVGTKLSLSHPVMFNN